MCRAGGGGREDGVASAGAEGCAGSVKVAKEKSSKLGMMSDHRHRPRRSAWCFRDKMDRAAGPQNADFKSYFSSIYCAIFADVICISRIYD